MDARQKAIATELTDLTATSLQTGLLFTITFGTGIILADVARERVAKTRDEVVKIVRNIQKSKPGKGGSRSLRDGPLASYPGELKSSFYLALGVNAFWEIGKSVAPAVLTIAVCGFGGMTLNKMSRSSSENLTQNALRSARFINAVKRGDI